MHRCISWKPEPETSWQADLSHPASFLIAKRGAPTGNQTHNAPLKPAAEHRLDLQQRKHPLPTAPQCSGGVRAVGDLDKC
jgi:hypothetical protein